MILVSPFYKLITEKKKKEKKKATPTLLSISFFLSLLSSSLLEVNLYQNNDQIFFSATLSHNDCYVSAFDHEVCSKIV